MTFQPLPGPVNYDPTGFARCLAELAVLTGVAEAELTGVVNADRHIFRRELKRRLPLLKTCFDAVVRAAVYDPDPSFTRWFVVPAVLSFGRERVLAALLNYLETGSNQERAGAARAWYSATGTGSRSRSIDRPGRRLHRERLRRTAVSAALSPSSRAA